MKPLFNQPTHISDLIKIVLTDLKENKLQTNGNSGT